MDKAQSGPLAKREAARHLPKAAPCGRLCPMPTCLACVDALCELAYSAMPVEAKIERATLLLRSVLEKPADPARAIPMIGFRPDLHEPAADLPATAPDGPIVGGTVAFVVGREVGQALGQAFKEQIDKPTLRQKLRALLCEG